MKRKMCLSVTFVLLCYSPSNDVKKSSQPRNTGSGPPPQHRSYWRPCVRSWVVHLTFGMYCEQGTPSLNMFFNLYLVVYAIERQVYAAILQLSICVEWLNVQRVLKSNCCPQSAKYSYCLFLVPTILYN